jgi:hypothetical protein
MEKKYDSAQETKSHICEVKGLLERCVEEIRLAALGHDISKLCPPEKDGFDEWTPKLKGSTYGSEEYNKMLSALSPFLDHHYKNNAHHPEHFENGVSGMDIFQILEMLMDWKAATLRHENGDILKSLEINKKCFKISDQLHCILKNTINNMGLSKKT